MGYIIDTNVFYVIFYALLLSNCSGGAGNLIQPIYYIKLM